MELDLDCRRCGLSRGRTHVVGPDGDLGSPVCFVGEAPGEKEDQQGRPFVGRAGKMLDRLLEEEGLPRDRIMITNTVKCRPPGNRTPKVEERRACLPYLEEELEGRQLVVALGRTACCNLMGKAVKMEEEVNRPREVTVGRERVLLLPAYHPAACLFNLNARASLRETIRIAKGFLRS